MAAPKEIVELVERFELQLESYKGGSYNETQLRREFLDPFFKLLGWDVDNKAGYAEAYKEVIHEDAIKIGEATKAPDYCFRVGGARKFFLEAKKPSVWIKNEPAPAFQLRRYAWSSKLPLSILSDFEEFAVYDCRIKPDQRDTASTARIQYLTFREYAEKWDDIASVFSREAVLKGSFDRYAESNKGKRGTADVDAEFLKTIESWRSDLAKNLARRNPKLTQRELNFAVQRIIDRIVFLRICEGRGIEDYGRLHALVNGAHVYRRLAELFTQADDRYNSGLFHFKSEKGRQEAPDELTLALEIDDSLLKAILKSLYYPESPYVFSALPADILGQVYEQFLGKVIRLTAGHQAVVEEKPEVKKAGGVYYTPTYIVEYIVRNTVGKLIDGIVADCSSRSMAQTKAAPARRKKSPVGVEPDLGLLDISLAAPPGGAASGEADSTDAALVYANNVVARVAKLRVIDPACGSGSFLLGAYDYLLDWHLKFYTANRPEHWAKGRRPALVQVSGSGRAEWRLTIGERKRILVANIYGVDIDAQAVETTKLSLLLKVLEGETQQSLQPLFRAFHERALPDLAENIKCGNSLIGPDFYAQPEMPILSDEERYRINVFDWESEFREIFRAGGFDAVIGNPPYVRQESLSAFKDYFAKHYEAFDGVADLYTYFIEKGVKLLRKRGLFSIIVSSSFLRANYGEKLRRTIKKHAAVRQIVDFGGLAVFANAKDTYVCIPNLEKAAENKNVVVSKVPALKAPQNLADFVSNNFVVIPHERLTAEAWSLKSDDESATFNKINCAGIRLGEYVNGRLYYGIKTGLNEAFIIDGETRRRLITEDRRSVELIHPLLGGEDIRRYHYNKTDKWLIFTRRGVNIDDYPAVRSHLANWKEDLTPKANRNVKRGRKPGRYRWYEIQDDVAYFEVFDGAKIIFPDICKGPRFTLDAGHYLSNTAYCLGTDDLYLLGILNSRLFWFAISNISIPFGARAGEYRYRLIYQYMEKVPIRVINHSVPSDKAQHGRIVKLVEQMLDYHKTASTARTPQEKTSLERHIAATDAQIDNLVYELYGLTPEEIAIVESSASKTESNLPTEAGEAE